MANLGEFTGTGTPLGSGFCNLVISASGTKLTSLQTVSGETVKNIANGVMNALVNNFTGVGTFGNLLNTLQTDNAANKTELALLRKLSANDRIVDENGLLTIFEDDGVTPLLQIQLKDKDSNNSYKNVLEWRRQ